MTKGRTIPVREAIARIFEEVDQERDRQMKEEGFTFAHDDEHDAGELCGAGAAYALNASCVLYPHNGTPIDDPRDCGWTWSLEWWKPTTPRRDLIKALALLVAEVERIDRLEPEAGCVPWSEAERLRNRLDVVALVMSGASLVGRRLILRAARADKISDLADDLELLSASLNSVDIELARKAKREEPVSLDPDGERAAWRAELAQGLRNLAKVYGDNIGSDFVGVCGAAASVLEDLAQGKGTEQ